MPKLKIMQIPNFSNYAITDQHVLVRNIKCTGGACGNTAQHYRILKTHPSLLVYEMFDNDGQKHYLEYEEVLILTK